MEIFTKNNTTPFKDSLLKEYDGLKLLGKNLEDNSFIKIPKVINVDEYILKIQKIDSSYTTKKLSSNLGYGLANLHKKVFENYGYKEDNYIGLNPQKNTLSKNWGEFFIEFRLEFQIELIKEKKQKEVFSDILNINRKKLENYLNENCLHPSVVHGDLWSGNVLYSKEGVYLIDPAVYYGDREVDIAMSEMFGGFDKEFYISYNEIYPLSDQYQNKKTIYNLYHYLNHYNLFGSSYLIGCMDGFDFIKRGL